MKIKGGRAIVAPKQEPELILQTKLGHQKKVVSAGNQVVLGFLPNCATLIGFSASVGFLPIKFWN